MTEEADKWNGLQSKFRQLALEEEREREGLSVYGNWEKHPHGEWAYNRHEVSIDLGNGLFSVLPGVSKDLEERFRSLATRAGKALGNSKDTKPADFWLLRLFAYSLEHNRPGLFGASEKGGLKGRRLSR
jgi:hypothetical protein